MYKIQKYTYDQAKKLNVQIKPSSNPKKKIDVYKNGQFLFSIGDIKYNDYPTYYKISPELAKQRRRLYKIRHEKDRHIKNSKGYYSDKLLW